MRVSSTKVPEDILTATRMTPDEISAECAIHLFENGKLSMGKAKNFDLRTYLPFFFENIIPSFSCKIWLKTNGAKKKTHNPITVYRNKSYK